MPEHHILLKELLLLNLYLGSIIFILGLIVLIILLYRKKSTLGIRNNQIMLLGFAQIFISYIISFLILRFWIFNIDPMIGFISIPALTSELVTIPLALLFTRRYFMRKYK